MADSDATRRPTADVPTSDATPSVPPLGETSEVSTTGEVPETVEAGEATCGHPGHPADRGAVPAAGEEAVHHGEAGGQGGPEHVQQDGDPPVDEHLSTASSPGNGLKDGDDDVFMPKGSPLLKEEQTLSIKDPEQDEPVIKYPRVVFFIVGNEFCERFSYYGLRTILSLFLNKALGLDTKDATVIYHVFAMLCYFFPILGAIISDSWLGKFKTIAYLSVVYAVGNIVVAFASATSLLGGLSLPLTFVGLVLISIGTGGIKPCVSAFGGDQFVLPQQARQLAAFFSVFYFSINAGSLISTYLTPELKAVACLGEKTCYPLAFGVPAALMLVSLVIFVIGKPGYKIVRPKENVLVKVAKCMWSGYTNKMKSKEKTEHWLDHADDRFDENLRSDIKAVLHVLLLFVPLPIFWALYDQQGSRWTFQANNMNGRFGSWVIKPDQVQVVNPLLILLFLPLFETVVYPALNKCRLLTRPLQKMAAGGIIAAIAFIISGILELQLEPHYPVSLAAGSAQVRVFNALPCEVTLNGNLELFGEAPFVLKQQAAWTRTDIAATGSKSLTMDVTGTCLDAGQKLTLDLTEMTSVSYHLYVDNPASKTLMSRRPKRADDLSKDSFPRIRLMYHFTGTTMHKVSFSDGKEVKQSVSLNGTSDYTLDPPLVPTEYSISVDGVQRVSSVLLDLGGVYTVLVDDSGATVITVIEGNVVNILWLIPQYVVMTAAEVMFSVTGLEFAFTQAPVSMKSVLQSAWLLTVAFGNLLVVLITESRFFASQAYEFFLFAALMLAVMLLFIWLATRYKYVEQTSEDDDVQTEQQPMEVMTSKPERNGDTKS